MQKKMRRKIVSAPKFYQHKTLRVSTGGDSEASYNQAIELPTGE
jgi:hypothetical protein